MNNDLYFRLTCALMHDMNACTDCKKCGDNYVEARMNLVRELAEATNNELPWEEEDK